MTTTTHDPHRGGDPRLVLTPGEHPLVGEGQAVFPLAPRTTFGSAPGCDVVLAGLAPEHAVVERTSQDEYVVRPLGSGHLVRVGGAPVVDHGLLRTGARVDVGPHTLVYVREEYADHGRPFGGRPGGEIGHQTPQPPRGAL